MPPILLVTGANSGVGLATARLAASRGVFVIALCRSPEKGAAAVASINSTARNGGGAELVLCDLADWSSVLDAAAKISKRTQVINAVVLNAGIAKIGESFEGPTVDKQGIDIVMSFLFGHTLLVRALHPVLCNTAANGRCRVIWTSSIDHWTCSSTLDKNKTLEHCRGEMNGKLSYRTCKLGHVQVAFALNRRYGLRLHPFRGNGRVEHLAYTPGLVQSNFVERSGINTPENRWLVALVQKCIAVKPVESAELVLQTILSNIDGGSFVYPYTTCDGLKCWDELPHGKRGLYKFRFEMLQRITGYGFRNARASPEAYDEKEQDALLAEIERFFTKWASEKGVALPPAPRGWNKFDGDCRTWEWDD
ncbi:short chain dehydrogenase [Pycnococcus provasolii]